MLGWGGRDYWTNPKPDPYPPPTAGGCWNPFLPRFLQALSHQVKLPGFRGADFGLIPPP